MNKVSRFPDFPRIYDCLGVGFGPSNIALAISLEERGLLPNCLFFETRDNATWQPGMLMSGVDIQHNPLRDLVTPRNPTSEYGFLSYLKEKGRLFDYLNLDAPYPPRTEYCKYVEWVANKFHAVTQFETEVVSIRARPDDAVPRVEVTLSNGRTFLGKTLSFASGRTLNVPSIFDAVADDRLIRVDNYLSSIGETCDRFPNPRIAVIGGSQSAAEIILDIYKRFPTAKIFNICRGFGLKQKDMSPFTEAIYYPEFIDYFHDTDEATQHAITTELKRSNYGAADHDVISEINFIRYEEKVAETERISLLFNKLIRNAYQHEEGPVTLALEDRVNKKTQELDIDAIVLATGFRNFGAAEDNEPIHPILCEIQNDLVFRSDGGVKVARDYAVTPIDELSHCYPSIFLNGLCEATHGFGDAGSFSLLSIRADVIASAIANSVRNLWIKEPAPHA